LLGQGMAIREANSLRNAADVLIAVAFGYFDLLLTVAGRPILRAPHDT
jgi:hypothetical protein